MKRSLCLVLLLTGCGQKSAPTAATVTPDTTTPAAVAAPESPAPAAASETDWKLDSETRSVLRSNAQPWFDEVLELKTNAGQYASWMPLYQIPVDRVRDPDGCSLAVIGPLTIVNGLAGLNNQDYVVAVFTDGGTDPTRFELIGKGLLTPDSESAAE